MTRRSGLGRGLDALLPSDTGDGALEGRDGLLHAPVGSITPNPRQPRQSFDEELIDELAASIRALGVLQPLLVRQRDSGYELIAGERRLRAATRAGLTEVPVLVIDTDETGSLERALVENVHRSDLNPIEEAAAYRQLIEDGGITQEALGEKLGKSRTAVTNALRLLDLPTDLQKLLIDGRLTARHGRELLALNGHPMQQRMALRVAQEGRSVRETADMVRTLQTMSTTRERSGSPSLPSAVTEAQRRLADHLQTRVKVEMGKRKGKIVLDFVSAEELDRITQTILGEVPGSSPSTVTLD